MRSINFRHAALLLAGLTLGVKSQEVQLIDSLFYRGVAAFQKGQYREALQNLEFLDRVYPGHRRSTGSLLMQGKALYHLNEHQRAVETCDELIKDYPASTYADDALYGKAKALYCLGVYEESVRTLFKLMEKGGDKRLVQKAAKMSSDIMDYRLDVAALRRLLGTVPEERGQAAITLRLVQRLVKNGQHQESRELLDAFIDKFPRSAYIVEIQQKIGQIEDLARGSLKIGVILPLSGDMAEQGTSVLSGIKYAVDQHNQKGLTKVELLVKDSQSDILTAIRNAQEICNDPDVRAIIGELESKETAAVAAVAQERGVPLLAPTASAQGLTEIGSNIFQLSPPLDVRAQTLAEYAVRGLGLKKFAILAETGEYGRTMHAAFKKKAEELGGQVMIEKWYNSGDDNLGSQFRAFREFGIQKMLKDTLLIRVSKKNLHNKPYSPDIQYVDRGLEGMVDSTGLSVTAFDGLFMPVLHEDLQYVIPQYAKYNLIAKVFGGVPWNDPELLEDQRRFIDSRYLDQLIFLSDFYVDASDMQYNQFQNSYRSAMGKNPDKLNVLGYDAASVLLHLIGDGRPEKISITRALTQLKDYQGIEGPVSFTAARANPNIHIMQYKSGKILLLK
jgi:branched-chain amino acid transport system substrate-binding protein